MSIRALVAVLLVALSGCGDPETVSVTGTVTYQGQPVEQGMIAFVSLTAPQARQAGTIEDGRFTLRAAPGRKKVEIRASRPLPAHLQDAPEMGLKYEDYLPARFNSETTLTAEVTPSGENHFEFALIE